MHDPGGPVQLLFLGISGYRYPHVRIRCYQFADRLKQQGFETEVLSFKDHLAHGKNEADMYSFGDRDRLWLVLKSIPRLWKYRNGVFYLQKAHYHTAGAIRLARMFNIPFILDYDDYEIGEDPHGASLFCGFNHSVLSRFFYGVAGDREVTERIARRAVCCVASSNHLAEFLSEFNSRVVTISTGVDTDMFTPAGPSDSERDRPFTFLWTGLIWGQTIVDNVCFMLNAFKLVLDHHPGVRLRIIGEGDRMEEVRKHALRHLPVGTVEFLPWLLPERMPEALRRADAGLLPLIDNSLWTRSKSPTKLFEYLAAGLPVVASRTGEAALVIRHGETGFLADDPESFAESMEKLCRDPALTAAMGRAARADAETQYSLAVLGNRLAGALKQYLKIS